MLSESTENSDLQDLGIRFLYSWQCRRCVHCSFVHTVLLWRPETCHHAFHSAATPGVGFFCIFWHLASIGNWTWTSHLNPRLDPNPPPHSLRGRCWTTEPQRLCSSDSIHDTIIYMRRKLCSTKLIEKPSHDLAKNVRPCLRLDVLWGVLYCGLANDKSLHVLPVHRIITCQDIVLDISISVCCRHSLLRLVSC